MPDHLVPLVATAFADLSDPRVDRTKEHQLHDILAIALCAVICGATSWVGVAEFGVAKQTWLRQWLTLRNGIPSHATFGRVFAALDATQFQEGFVLWMRVVCPLLTDEVIAIDGKTLRRSHDQGIGKGAIHMVSAWASNARLVLAQRKVDDKANELIAIPELLQVLDLQGCTVTIDAMGCQTALARQIVHQGGDYVLAVKDTHPQLHADIAATFHYVMGDGWQDVAHDHHRTTTGAHGRIEMHDYWLITEPDYLA